MVLAGVSRVLVLPLVPVSCILFDIWGGVSCLTFNIRNLIGAKGQGGEAREGEEKEGGQVRF